jgi:glycosyltransferase involved in cell wall biosynthesis
MRSSRILAITSAVEGFGIVAVEANALGIPVIASTGVPEGAVRDGFNGLRYPFGDAAALSERITRLLKDPTLYERLSRNAFEHAARFSWSQVGAQFERVVLQAAAGSR